MQPYRIHNIRGKPGWLFDTTDGVTHLFDEPFHNSLAQHWTGERLSNSSLRTPRRALPVFNGQALLVNRPHAHSYDLIDLDTLKTTLTLRLVTVEDAIGWVAYTPDGYWDASPGAEQYIAVYRGLDALDAKAVQLRRQPQRVKDAATRYRNP